MKTYNVKINKIKVFSFSEFNELIEKVSEIEKHWEQIGGKCKLDDYSCVLYGTNEILTEFLLTYTLSQYLSIVEVK